MVVDKSNMLRVIDDFPLQCQGASELGRDITIKGDIRHIVIAGMGGSAIPGDVLNSYLRSKTVVYTCRDYDVPAWVGKNSLVFANSYSGNTEETLSSYRSAVKQGANIVVTTSGGKLGKIAEENKNPVIKIPPGYQPRAAVGYLFLPMLNVLENCGLVDAQKDVSGMIEDLKSPRHKEEAQKLAEKLVEKIPLIYSSGRLRAIAMRWKCQFDENSKVMAFYNVLSELNHNEIVGYTVLKGNFFTIFLSDEGDHPRIKKRVAVTKRLIEEKGCPAVEIKTTGRNNLSRIFSTIYLGDYASYFLAMKNNVDPTPVGIIENLKREIA